MGIAENDFEGVAEEETDETSGGIFKDYAESIPECIPKSIA